MISCYTQPKTWFRTTFKARCNVLTFDILKVLCICLGNGKEDNPKDQIQENLKNT